MKMMEGKYVLLTMIIVQAALAMPVDHTESIVDFVNEQIVGSDTTPNGQFFAVMTKSMQLRVYQLYKQTYKFVNQLSSCQGTTIDMSESTDAVQGKSIVIDVKCKNLNIKSYKFLMNSFQLKEITQQKNKIEQISQQNSNKIRSGRLLQTANTTNSTCGNGTKEGNQTCDDGNTNSSDGCSNLCVLQFCGDGIVNNVNETCDDGNTVSGDGCSATCQFECGNNVLDSGETCDDGNRVDGDGCSSTCILETVSPALPLALGIPLVVLALLGLLGAKVAMTKGAVTAGTTYLAQQPARIVQVEESTKIVRVQDH